MKPVPITPATGQESVWDYPRPAILEPSSRLVTIKFAGQTIAETRGAYRVLETSHPPTWYLPPGDVADNVLRRLARTTMCEWKGRAFYADVVVGQHVAHSAAWGYDEPTAAFAAITGYVAFYAHAMDECRVDGELVEPQPGGFYGGWITPDVVGPFKGITGSWGW